MAYILLSFFGGGLAAYAAAKGDPVYCGAGVSAAWVVATLALWAIRSMR